MCPSKRCDGEMTLMGEGHDGRVHVRWWWCEPPDGCGRFEDQDVEVEAAPQPDLFGGGA